MRPFLLTALSALLLAGCAQQSALRPVGPDGTVLDEVRLPLEENETAQGDLWIDLREELVSAPEGGERGILRVQMEITNAGPATVTVDVGAIGLRDADGPALVSLGVVIPGPDAGPALDVPPGERRLVIERFDASHVARLDDIQEAVLTIPYSLGPVRYEATVVYQRFWTQSSDGSFSLSFFFGGSFWGGGDHHGHDGHHGGGHNSSPPSHHAPAHPTGGFHLRPGGGVSPRPTSGHFRAGSARRR